MKFLLDAQLPSSLAGWLQERGCEAVHVAEIGLQYASDETIWAAALERQAILVTKDRDFNEWALNRHPRARVLWLRFGNTRNRFLMARLEAVWPEVLEGLQSNVSVIEVGNR